MRGKRRKKPGRKKNRKDSEHEKQRNSRRIQETHRQLLQTNNTNVKIKKEENLFARGFYEKH